ncbi:MAG: hypothetical protein QOH46_3729 [Solirubrobacteraceae bacterium]|nr:hypothetical protein [Solirubrobacteraceae bacterium]
MTDLDAAQRFVWLHARLIDRHRFAHLFGDAGAESVARTLRAYRNDDGGFGHALEPDLRTPTSQPAAGQHALEMLAESGALDDPMARGACDFLESISQPDGGVPFVLPAAMEHPRAPWWQPSEESSLIQTAANAAVLLEAGFDHPWLDGATAFCWSRVADLRFDSAYDAKYAVAFLDAVPDADRAEAELDRIRHRLVDSGLVALDPGGAGGTFTPLDYSPWPGGRSRRLFEPDVIESALDALAAGQQDDGGWTFAWPAWAPAAVHEWRGWITVHALKLLRANGRLPAVATAGPARSTGR